MASITKRNGRYHVRVRKIDIPTQCKSFLNRKDAQRWAYEVERAADNGDLLVEDCRLHDLLDRYRSEISSKKRGADVEKYRIQTLQKSSLSSILISRLKPNHIARYRDERLKVVSPASVKRELVILSHAITIAMTDWGYEIPSNPCHRVRKPTEDRARDRRLVGDEYERLITSCRKSDNPYLEPLVTFATETAMRRGELLSLNWCDVHLEDRYCTLPMTKNGDSRDVPLSSTAISTLKRLVVLNNGSVFPIQPANLRGLWKRATKRAGIDDLHFHDLRHEATSRLFEKGLNVMEVASITGHKDLRMLQRYTHLKATDLAERL